jgi:hypothetical protein
MADPAQIVRSLESLQGGKRITIVCHDGRHIPATTSMVYQGDSAGVVAYDMNTRKAIPRSDIKGWIAARAAQQESES